MEFDVPSSLPISFLDTRHTEALRLLECVTKGHFFSLWPTDGMTDGRQPVAVPFHCSPTVRYLVIRLPLLQIGFTVPCPPNAIDVKWDALHSSAYLVLLSSEPLKEYAS